MKTAPKMLSFENVFVLRWKICGIVGVARRRRVVRERQRSTQGPK
jgi:hypothetical protein